MLKAQILSVIAAGAALAACGEDSVNIDGVTRHACIHGEYGPFEMVASAEGAQAPDVSTAHTAFVIDLSGSGSEVKYEAKEKLAHVFYTDNPGAWSIRDGSGELSAFTEQDPGDLCEYFSRACSRLLQNSDNLAFGG